MFVLSIQTLKNLSFSASMQIIALFLRIAYLNNEKKDQKFPLKTVEQSQYAANTAVI